MTKDERQRFKALAARMTPELMRSIMERVTDSDRDRTAVILLDCFATLMIEGDPITRLEAREHHARVLRWLWGRQCERDWKGSPMMEVQ